MYSARDPRVSGPVKFCIKGYTTRPDILLLPIMTRSLTSHRGNTPSVESQPLCVRICGGGLRSCPSIQASESSRSKGNSASYGLMLLVQRGLEGLCCLQGSFHLQSHPSRQTC